MPNRRLMNFGVYAFSAIAEAAGYARLYLIARRGNLWVGVADPRHDGQPRGY